MKHTVNPGCYAIGIDVGSTTVKLVVNDDQGNRIYAKYQRHFAYVRDTLLQMLQEIRSMIGSTRCTFAITGSGGLNLANHMGIPFIQEVVAVAAAIRQIAPQTDVVIELGGEDAKIIFLRGGVEQRMNGICAGGTGAFIDQMAALLQTDATGLNEYAKNYKELYPIAARCGVFAKSDIQPLINDGVPREDLAASIFQAVVTQTISGLACGRRITGNIAFLGGPLFFLSELRAAFIRTLNLTDDEVVFPQDAHLFAAAGAAARGSEPLDFEEVLAKLQAVDGSISELTCLPRLFESEEDYKEFRNRQSQYAVKKRDLATYEGNCFLGIDAGSTTMKMTVISEEGELLYAFYGSNQGDPISVAQTAFRGVQKKLGKNAKIVRACSTGYGETLLKDAFRLEDGEVETIAHYYAARFFQPDVDCILDIGGQDMKCIKIKDGCVDTIILNEACSSGCGSFIENFANSLGYTAQEFAFKALFAKKPVDLGTRCTIFMNSNVKQAQKEGATVEDIAAGLAYSVIKNALFKVIKLTDAASLGKHTVVQGGTFYNDAILRSFELVAEHEAIRPDIAGLMGAFGAALIARENYDGQASTMMSLEEIAEFSYKTSTAHCNGCQNHCRLTVNKFSDGRRHISGNRCERGLQQKKDENTAPNLFAYKKERLFCYEPLSEEAATRGTIGLPRVLNLYENYPFWATFFKELGFRTVLSPYSNRDIFQLGMDSIPSESECYPAKLTHGHVEWLIKQGVNTIFYPCVYYERHEREAAMNHYNCPMVISYPENLKNNMESLNEQNVRFLNPFLAFTDEYVLSERLSRIMKDEFGISRKETTAAVMIAWNEHLKFRYDVEKAGEDALAWIEEHQGHGFILAGRPYHLDPEVNHGIPEMIHSFGYAVLTEDSVAHLQKHDVKLRATNQWTYHARLYAAAQYAATRDDLDVIQLNSFGCGLDAVTIDQVQDLLTSAGKLYTLLKIDEVNNLGAAKIRVRSAMAALKTRQISAEGRPQLKDYERVEFTKEMREQGYTILCTEMAPFHFDLIEAAFRSCGYNVEVMKNEGQRVLDMGLKYVNNDACYPAMIVTGQIVDAVTSGKYDTNKLAVAMSQTGGGCRASNYMGFIRKALKDAGYEHIPVISVSAYGIESNSGFSFTPKILVKALQALFYGDLMMRMIFRVRPYEQNPGDANALLKKWRDRCITDISANSLGMGKFNRNCREMVRDFDTLPLKDVPRRPRVGIVGEVLVKFMPLANNHLSDLLEEEGAEVVLPDLMDFLEYCFWSPIYRAQFLGTSKKTAKLTELGLAAIEKLRSPIIKALKESERFTAPEPLANIREDAQEVLQLGNQCGEGWFLAGEIVELLHSRVDNVVCIQPFGCLPNHIVGKGIIKRLKEIYPMSNIAAIDYDPSASRVNQLNRIKLMLEVARENLEKERAEQAEKAPAGVY